MKIFPAIDLIDGCAVRLVRGDYAQKTVYSDHPADVALQFRDAGAEYIHLVDLNGAKDGTSPNFATVRDIVRTSGLKAEIGGGIRSEETILRYLDAGVTLHLRQLDGTNSHHIIEAAFKGFGRALAQAVAPDPKSAGEVPSTKGVL